MKWKKHFTHLSKRHDYHPLDDGAQEIRLLTLKPGTFDSKIRILLDPTRLTEDAVPQFEALSYAWGSVKDQKSILVGPDGRRTLTVTQNLEDALRHLRYEDRKRTMWIDAICVNQQDLGERSRQVKRMTDIYSKAARVVIWLGPERDHSTQALDLLSYLSSRVEVDWLGLSMRSISVEASEAHWGNIHTLLPYSASEFLWISSLLDRSWFERLWVWQEVRAATRDAVIMCGTKTILWKSFQDAVYCLYVKSHSPMAPSTLQYRKRLVYNLCDTESHLSFKRLLAATTSCKCSDPRDRIFALKSMLQENEKSLLMEPDYTKNIFEVYTESVRRCIESQSLEILTITRLRQRHQEMPTWVPDFSIPHLSIPIPDTFASLSSSPGTRIEGKSLQVTGVAVATIDNLEAFQNESMTNREWMMYEIRRVAAQLHILPPLDPTSPKVRALCQTLSLNQVQERFYPPPLELARLNQCQELVHRILDSQYQYDGQLLSASDNSFLNSVVFFCSSRSLFSTTKGHLGLGPAEARAGDLVTVLLGCDSAMILRPVENGQYQVVGESYCHGVADGEALLGTLSNGWEVRRRIIDFDHSCWWFYLNPETGKGQVEDPRLGPLPKKWRKKSHDYENFWAIFVNDETGEEAWRDPRLKPEALVERGIELRVFDLV